MIATTTTLSLGEITNGEDQEQESLRLAVTVEKEDCNGTRHQMVGGYLIARQLSIRAMESQLTKPGMQLVMQMQTRTLTHRKVFSGGKDDPYAATRRAIVRAAAEIGGTM